jgi:hypothetical protein
MTVLVGLVPCRLSVENRRSRKHGPDSHRWEQMWQALGNMPDGQVKRPRLMSVEGREIVGPGFSAGPRVCAARSEDGNRSRIRQSGPVEKTTAPGMVSEPRCACPG